MEGLLVNHTGVLGAAGVNQLSSQPSANRKSPGSDLSQPGPGFVPHGVRVVQNGRPVLEDAFSQSSIPAGGSCQLDGAAQPLAYFGVFDGHGGPEVAHHAAERLHKHFQAAYQQQLATAAQLAGAGGSGSSMSEQSVAALDELMLYDTWHSSSSSDESSSSSGGVGASTDVTSSDGEPSSVSTPAGAGNSLLRDVLTAAAAAAAGAPAVDSSCSSPTCSSTSTSSSSGSPTSQQVWAAINSNTSSSSSRATPTGLAAGTGVGTQPSVTPSLRGRLQQRQQRQQQQHPSRASRLVVQSLREAFLRTDAELAGTEVGEVVGTTALTAVLSPTQLFIGHCGDSRAVLCRKGVALPLTSDHKPGRSDEMARVAALGGRVVYKAGGHRVMGLLAMSRALGDHFLRPYVIPEPEVLCLQRSQEDELLILATDGLWDVFTCQEATTLALRSTIRARQRGASAAAACRVGASVLVRGAIERGSRDNITVAVLDLRLRAGGQGEDWGGVGGECFVSVASVLASQCSSDLAGLVSLPPMPAVSPAVGSSGSSGSNGGGCGSNGGSRKRRSSSGNGDEEEGGCNEVPAAAATAAGGAPAHGHNHQQHQQQARHVGSCVAVASTAATPAAAPAGTVGYASNARRHTATCDGSSGGSIAYGPAAYHSNILTGSNAGGSSSSSGGSSRGLKLAWGWSLQGLQLLPPSQESRAGSSIHALAQAAAAAVAAFSRGGASGSDAQQQQQQTMARSGSGIPREAAAAITASRAAAAAAGAAGGAVQSMAGLLSMASAPVGRVVAGGSSSSRGTSSSGKPPLPHQQQRDTLCPNKAPVDDKLPERIISPFAVQYEADIDRLHQDVRVKTADLLGQHASTLKVQARNLTGQAGVLIRNIQQRAMEKAKQTRGPVADATAGHGLHTE